LVIKALNALPLTPKPDILNIYTKFRLLRVNEGQRVRARQVSSASHKERLTICRKQATGNSPVLHCYSRALSWPNACLFVDVSVPGSVRKYEL